MNFLLNVFMSLNQSRYRRKGSMSGDARYFKYIETRAVVRFFFLQGKAPKDIYAILTEKLGEHVQSYTTIKNWAAQFKRGDFSTYVAPRPGPPKTVTTPDIIDRIHELIFHENAPAHRALATQKNLSYLGFQRLDHPFCSPDLAPSDYHLFPGLKKELNGRPFFVRRGAHCCRGDLVGWRNFWIFLVVYSS